jgi:hypothetical protein
MLAALTDMSCESDSVGAGTKNPGNPALPAETNFRLWYEVENTNLRIDNTRLIDISLVDYEPIIVTKQCLV